MEDETQLEKFKEEIKKEELVPLGWQVIKSDQLLKMKLPEVEFLVENLIPSGAITILSGNPGSCKSWLLLEIAKVAASNRCLFEKFNVKEKKVLYIDEEASLVEIKRRWAMLNPPILTLVDFVSLQGFKIDIEEHRKTLLDFAKWRGYKLIIFDSLRDIHNRNENDSREAQEIINYLREFTREGIAILVSHHHRKESFLGSKEPSQAMRGSTAIWAGIDSLLTIEKTKDTAGEIELTITQTKLRQGKAILPFKVSFIEKDGKMRFEYIGEIETEITKLEQTKKAILELLEEGEKYQAEIVQSLVPLYFSERTIVRAIKELKEERKIQPRTGERRRIYLGLVE